MQRPRLYTPRVLALCALSSPLLSPLADARSRADDGRAQAPADGPPRIVQLKLGNVFVVGEPVRLRIENSAALRWQARDFDGKQVAAGQAQFPGGAGELSLPLRQSGYFSLHIQSVKPESGVKPELEASTSLAIVPPLDLSKVSRSPFGVMTHFAQNWNPDIIPLIALAGAKHDRDEIYWAHIEEKPGVFAAPPRFDAYMSALRASHITPLVPLTFENPLYDAGQTPYTPAGFEGYSRYGAQVLVHYPQAGAVEVWNEYNGSFCHGPACDDRAATYASMLKAAYPVLKRTRPDVPVVGISTAGIPLPFIEKVFQAGGLGSMDAISVHPYRYGSAPEGFEDDIARLDQLIRRYNGGKPKPIWVTEVGWFLKQSQAPGDISITEADQAKFLARGYSLLLSAGVEKIFWYLFRDYAEFATMGLVRDESSPQGRYAPKPAFVAYATMARQLRDARFVRREATAEGVYSLLFHHGSQDVRVMWSLKPTVLAATSKAPLVRASMMGQEQVLVPAQAARLSLSDAPIYVRGALALPPVPPQQQRSPVLADSRRQFSSQQNADGWSYGSIEAATPDAPYDFRAWQALPQHRITDWKSEWAGAPPYLSISEDAAHPGSQNGHAVWAIRRWTSAQAGRLRITGRAGCSTEGDGVRLRIFVDGAPIFDQALGGADQAGQRRAIATEFDVVADVKAGSKVDFALDPGPKANIEFDATSWTATIRRAAA